MTDYERETAGIAIRVKVIAICIVTSLVLTVGGVAIFHREDPADVARVARTEAAEAAKDAQKQRASDAADDRIAAAQMADVKKVLNRLNHADPPLFVNVGASRDGRHLFVTVDGDVWDDLTTQDKSLTRKVLHETFAKTYRAHHVSTADYVLAVKIENEAGDVLANDW